MRSFQSLSDKFKDFIGGGMDPQPIWSKKSQLLNAT